MSYFKDLLMDLKKQKTDKNFLVGFHDCDELFENLALKRNLSDAYHAAEAKNDLTDGTMSIGLEDSKGNIVKVTISKRDEKNFKKILKQHIEDSQKEIEKTIDLAELIYSLRKDIKFLDIEWHRITEDEDYSLPDTKATDDEEVDDIKVDDEEGDEEGDEEANDEEANDDEDEEEGETDDGEDGDSATKLADALKSVLEYLNNEAEARKKEAAAKIAEYNYKATQAAIIRAEEKADIEKMEKEKKEEEQKQKELDKIAKIKNEIKG